MQFRKEWIGIVWIVCVGLAVPFLQVSAGPVLNEILFDPSGPDTGSEWVEVYNSDNSSVDLSGWQLYLDGTGYFLFPVGFRLAGKNFVTIHLRLAGVNSADQLYYNSASSTSNMSNTSGSVALFSQDTRNKDTIKSFVEWGRGGQTWEGAAGDAGLWQKGTYVDLTNFVSGNSIGLLQDGNPANGVTVWTLYTAPTPGVLNSRSSLSESPADSSRDATVSSPDPVLEESQNFAPLAYRPLAPVIHAYAGEDKSVVAGSSLELSGTVLGLKNKLLGDARTFWNFGDGETQEGHLVRHIFRFPGSYQVGFHASSGEFAASDYLTVRVIPNQINITSVVPGEGGFVRWRNPSGVDIDIGGWNMEDKTGRKFTIPAETKFGAHSEIAFANISTGLLSNTSTVAWLQVRYSNLATAFSYPSVGEPAIISISSMDASTPISRNEISADPIEKIQPAGPIARLEKPSLGDRQTAATGTLSFQNRMAADVGSAMPDTFSRNSQTEASAPRKFLFSFGPHAFFLIALLLGVGAAVGFLLLKKI